MLAFLTERMDQHKDSPAIAEPCGVYTYGELLSRFHFWIRRLAEFPVKPGAVATVEGDYGLETIAVFLALASNRNIAVPLSRDSRQHADSFIELAEVQYRIAPGRAPEITDLQRPSGHALFEKVRSRNVPGLVLFSSGSTGKSKAAVHDLSILLKKFQVQRHRFRTLVFLQLDHIGGVNTLFYTLSNGGAVVIPQDRSPALVAEAIARHRVQLLPTSPTFLNLLLLSGEWERQDLSSLELITYGTETMPESTLKKVAEAFPKAKLLQTYGLTELGILRSQSRGSDSLWVRVGGEGYETKVVDDRLWIRAESAMLGYLNAPSPFDEEGFFNTGDRVLVDGEWLRILGREADIINVGGSKVYPAETEDVLLQMDNVKDAVVYAEPNPITGQMVVARIRLEAPEDSRDFKLRMRIFCRDRLAPYKIPAKIQITADPLHSSRYKRMRRQNGPGAALESDSPM